MNKGIWLNSDPEMNCGFKVSDLDNYSFNTVFIAQNQIELYHNVKIHHPQIKHFIVHIQHKNYEELIRNMDVEYYYVDEPYIRGLDGNKRIISIEIAIKDRRDYIKEIRPNSKLVVGDIRHILKKDYQPIPGIFYTYTSYIGTFLINDIPMPFGLPNQSSSIKRLAHIVGKENIPFIWLFGKNKILCHPDEYEQLTQTCIDLDIETQVLYINTGTERQETCVGKEQLGQYINSFIKGENPYTLLTWWKRFFKSIITIVKLVKD